MAKKVFQPRPLFSIFIFVLLVSPYFVFAQTVDQKTSVPDLQTQIQDLLQQIQALQKQVSALQQELGKQPEKTTSAGEIPVSTAASGAAMSMPAAVPPEFTRSLSRGSSGDDVRKLQEFLANDKDIYPDGLITGFFGPLTEAAVKRWQEKHGIESIGIIGPKSIAKFQELGQGRLQQLIEQGAGASGVIPPGLLTAPGIQKKVEIPVTATSSTAITAATATPAGVIPAVPAVPATPAQPSSGTGTVAVPATPATPAIATVIPTPNVTSTSADTTPPKISNTQVIDLTAPVGSLSKATITWTTDEPSNSWVYYSTTPLLATTTPLKSGDDQNLTSHNVSLAGLYYVQTYYYVIVSKDTAGNTATSSEQSFLTPAQYTPSGVMISNIRAVSPYYEGTQIIDNLKMTVAWDTDVRSSTRVEYGLTPVYGQGMDWNEGVSHSVTLTQLDVGETYYYRVQSGQTVSPGQTFTTPFGGTTISTVTSVSQNGSSPPVMCKLKYDGAIQVTNPRFTIGVLTDKPAAVNFKMSKDPSMSQPFVEATDAISSYAIHNLSVGGVATGTTYYLQMTATDSGSSVTSQIYSLTIDGNRFVPGAYTLYSDLTTPFCSSQTSQSPPYNSRQETFASLDLRAKNLVAISQTLNAIKEKLLKLLQGL